MYLLCVLESFIALSAFAVLGQHDYWGWGGAVSSPVVSHGRDEKRARDASSRRALRCVAVLVSSRLYDIIRETRDESGGGGAGLFFFLIISGSFIPCT